jgi:hypothetical protein
MWTALGIQTVKITIVQISEILKDWGKQYSNTGLKILKQKE